MFFLIGNEAMVTLIGKLKFPHSEKITVNPISIAAWLEKVKTYFHPLICNTNIYTILNSLTDHFKVDKAYFSEKKEVNIT